MSQAVANGPPPPRRTPMALLLARFPHLPAHLGGIAALALVLVSSDAFGSDDLPLSRQALMFGIISTLLVGQASLLADGLHRLRGSSLGGSAPAAAAAVLAVLFLMTLEVHALKATPIVPYAPDPLPEFAFFLMPFVLPVSGLVIGLKWSAPAKARPDRRTFDAADATPGVAILVAGSGQLSDGTLRGWPPGPVRRVQAVDHYLHLWTPEGMRLVRGQMRDALRHLPAQAGMRVHRSWWVARAEIDRMERRGRDYVLLLTSGERIPVARARVDEVRRLLRGRG